MSSFLDSVKIGAIQGGVTGFLIGAPAGLYTGLRGQSTRDHGVNILGGMVGMTNQVLFSGISGSIWGGITGGVTHLIAPNKSNKEKFIKTASSTALVGMWALYIGMNLVFRSEDLYTPIGSLFALINASIV
ncbi:MAG: hypothetical protein K1000chlam1_00695 [Candidatus Anoxychlamydiales bacterium]|nr:hypothetical protein [Candidatus Anoxychlamydiales bacterium]